MDETPDQDAEGGGEDERPKYTVYRAGSDESRSADAPAESRKRAGDRAGDDPPSYTVYRSRRGPLASISLPDLTALREKLRRPAERPPGERPRTLRESAAAESRPTPKPAWRKILRWSLIGAAAWIAFSAVVFVISATIQQGKLADDAVSELAPNPLMLLTGGNTLVIGTDARPAGTNAAEIDTNERCVDAGAVGKAPPSGCGGYRADTLMVVRASSGRFSKLSIPRDTIAEIPGLGAEKINAAYNAGGAQLQIETVENFLGIDINHVVLIDFEGFADFIDALGGVTVNNTTRLKAKIDGGSSQGGITLKLDRGPVHLDGQRALAYARTRKNEREPAETDLDRARRQQAVLNAIKSRLTSPWRIPVNFLRGPLIGWNAPRAMVTDMAAPSMLQLGFAAAVGGDSETRILGSGQPIIPRSVCRKAVRRLFGENPPGQPACSPGG